MAYVFNPFTGNFDAVTDPLEAPLSFPANCQSADDVGDCVYVSGDVIAGTIQVAKVDIADTTKMPSIGIITSKSGSTSCIVAFFGSVDLSPAVPGKIYFVGADAKPTATRPAGPALIQVVGVALDTARLLLNPSPNMTKVLS